MKGVTLFGLHAVRQALRLHPEAVLELFVSAARAERDGQSGVGALVSLAERGGVAVQRVRDDTLDQMAGASEHQGVVARRRPWTVPALSDLCQPRPPQGAPSTHDANAPLFLVLDQVQDPHNLGAALRVADAAGVRAIIVPGRRAAHLSGVAAKVASGAAETVPVLEVGNLAQALEELKAAGIWIVGLDGEADTDLFAQDLTGPVALVMGSEGEGLRRLTREHCDFLVSIPMLGAVESLNVSTASAVCLFEAVRQRTQHLRS